MKPKTKLQKQVVSLSEKLGKITPRQRNWALEECLPHRARRIKSKITCLDCGHSWRDQGVLCTSVTKCVCPSCSRKLEIEDTTKRKFDAHSYFGIVTTYQGFQVLRYFLVKANYRLGEYANKYMYEVTQHWIRPDGKYETMGMLEGQSFYAEYWYDNLEIRSGGRSNYNFTPNKIYPYTRYIPEIKRAGFRETYNGITPLNMFVTILTNNQAETLLKTKQYELLKHSTFRGHEIAEHWASIRICMRNNYIVPDAVNWIDYLNLLKFFGRDLRSPRYVCPKNLEQEHDQYTAKRRKIREQEALEEKRIKAIEDEKIFKEMKQHLLDIEFSDNLIHIRPLQNVQEFIYEGDILHHCVFQSDYYLRKDSLILSARIDDMPIETIEISLSKMEIIQSRGKYNKRTQYHDRIIDLVNKNMSTIHKRVSV